MLLPPQYQLVPSSLLALLFLHPLLSQTLQLPWPLNIAAPAYHHRRGDPFEEGDTLEHAVLARQLPVGVRKMSGDEGEMFFLNYWNFESGIRDSSEMELDKRKPALRLSDPTVDGGISKDTANFSIPQQQLQAPFALHTVENPPSQPRGLKSPRGLFPLDKRDFQCPGDTNVCASVNRPNSCCPKGSTCQLITDTGSGDVGCCGEGQTCDGEVAACPSGDTSCPGASGGGCCIAGYACAGVGCIVSSTVTTTVQPVVTVSPPSSSIASISTDPSGILNIPVVPVTTNTDPTTSTSTFTAVTSVTSTATASSTPPSSTPRPTTTTSATAILPLRPTSSTVPTTTATAPPTTITASQCPTGFYQCSAYDHPGCCRVGRDCGLTSCPAGSSTLAINSNGVTVSVIPSGTGDAALGEGGCAQGWFSCESGQGGGCCPSGYACGTSCTATAVVVQNGQTGTAEVAKNNLAGVVESTWWVVMGGTGFAIFLVLY